MEHKVMVVTGASSGIGFCTAMLAQETGWQVIWISRKVEESEQARLACNDCSELYDADVSSEESVKRLFQYVAEKYDRLDALVNCAGYVDPQGLLATSLDNWDKTIRINLTGTFLCCKHAVPVMKEWGGKIVNISSTAGLTPRPGWSAYAASKGGIISFTEAIAEELAVYNIKVFTICPGRTATPLRKILAPNEDPTTIMQPQTVAKTILFCMSEEADPLEGQPILVRERF